MSLAGWNADQKLKLTIPQALVDTAQSDIAVPIAINATSGVSDYDATDVFDKLSPLDPSDNFTGDDGDPPNPTLWSLDHDMSDAGSDTSGTTAVQGNTLALSVSAAISQPVCNSNWKVASGEDFDIQVDFDLAATPSPDSNWLFGLELTDTLSSIGTRTVYAYMHRETASRGPYRAATNNATPVVGGSADLTGKLRIVRIGSTLTAYRWNGSSWTLMLTDSSFSTDELWVVLCARMWVVGGDLDVSYDNFVFDSGVITWPTTPLKFALEQGDTGNQCYIEKVDWDHTNKKAIIWAKLPTLASGADNLFCFYYDEAHVDNTTYVGATGSTPAQTVYTSKYAAVYHLNNDPTGGTGCILDSTANANHGTPQGTWAAGDLVDGLVGKSLQFSGDTGEYISVPDDGSLDFTAGMTAIVLINPDDVANNGVLMKGPLTSAQGVYQLSIATVGDGHYFRINNSVVEGSGQVSGGSPIADNWITMAGTYDQVNQKLIVNGSLVTTDGFTTVISTDANPLNIGCYYTTGFCFSGKFESLILMNQAQDESFIEIMNLSLRDELITWSSLSVRNILSQLYGDYTEPRCAIMSSLYALLFSRVQTCDLVWSLRILATMVSRYGDVAKKRQILNQIYQNARQVMRMNVSRYGNYISLLNTLEQEWIMKKDIRALFQMLYIISGKELTKIHTQLYNLNENKELLSYINQIWVNIPGEGLNQSPTFSVVVDGVDITAACKHITIDNAEIDYAIRGELHIVKQDAFLICKHMVSVLTITINTDIFTLMVDAPRKSRPESTMEEYYVPFSSPAVLLDAPYADSINEKYDSDLASNIVAALAAIENLSVSWDMLDWTIPEDILYANDETPLEIIRKIVSTAGGVIQSDPDGTLVCRHEYPISVNQWDMADADYYLTDMDNFFSVDSSPFIREGFNHFILSDQDPASPGRFLEEESISNTAKIIKMFNVPWNDDITATLLTSGGVWVGIEYIGIYEELITEVVEIVNGEGNTSSPIYEKIAQDYKQTSLGTVTISEDGGITTEVLGNSLLEITYNTKYYKFIGRSPNIEQVQFYPAVTGE